MQDKDRQLVQEFKKRLSGPIAVHVRKVLVFGSRAMDRAVDESDLDLIVLVDEKTPDIEQTLEDVAYDVMWQFDFKPIISLKVFGEAQFQGGVEKGYSFYKNVEKEGVAV